MNTFYFVVKNGEHSDTSCDEVVERFEIDCDYPEGIKILRCIINIFKDWIRLSKIMGRTK